MEELKRESNDSETNYISEIEVHNLRGVRVVDHDTLESPRFTPRKINVITGCNGSFKTTFLEALTVSLYMTSANIFNARSIFGLASTLRMDPLWHYLLAKDGFEMIINGQYKVSNASLEEVRKVNPIQPINPLVNPVGFRLLKNNEEMRVLRVDVLSILPQSAQISISIQNRNEDEIKVLPTLTFIAFSTPNPISTDFVSNFSPLINFSKMKNSFKKLLNFELIGVKLDEFGRLTFAVSDGNKDVEIQFLGSGFASLILLAMASSNDIVIFDNIENHLHPQLMIKAIELMKESDSQWFITTQSTEFLNYLLLENPDKVMVYEFLKRDSIHIRQIEGNKARELINELSEDLRGLC
ncbi:MAG: AAA family ATPase [Saccharolobus sp.]|uniref:AAA family ATPase n=1 Tax=Saccharolobus TaxID=2100760 RepID=UPI001F10AD13|nr:AAA family ATPase [Saccharolobus shibatae]MCH4816754.1 AAA family ATPase [Saccharolobus shibatae]